MLKTHGRITVLGPGLPKKVARQRCRRGGLGLGMGERPQKGQRGNSNPPARTRRGMGGEVFTVSRLGVGGVPLTHRLPLNLWL